MPTQKVTIEVTITGGNPNPPTPDPELGTLVIMPSTFDTVPDSAILANLYFVKDGVFKVPPASATINFKYADPNPGISLQHIGQGQIIVNVSPIASNATKYQVEVEVAY